MPVLGNLTADCVAERGVADVEALGVGEAERNNPDAAGVVEGRADATNVGAGAMVPEGAGVGEVLTIWVVLEPPKMPRNVVFIPCGRK